jgi:hypothetical protein
MWRDMKISTLLLFIQTLFLITLGADEIVVRSPAGEHYVIDVAPEETFHEVMNRVEKSIIEPEQQIASNDSWFNFKKNTNKAPAPPRDYSNPVTLAEFQDISYIVNTLSKSSYAKILASKGSLKKAGDRIDHLHPLRFLMCVFTDEELKVGVHMIRNDSWVWPDFFDDGLKKSLIQEASRNNMKPEFVQDFARQVGVDYAKIAPLIQAGKWRAFVDTLIEEIPRDGEPDRHDQ